MHNIDKKESVFLFKDGRLFAAEEKLIKEYQVFHWHDFYEIEYVLEGEGEYIINGTSFEIAPNMLFFSTSSDFHEINFYVPTKIITVQFHPIFIEQRFRNLISGPIVLTDSKGVYINYLKPICEYQSLKDECGEIFVKNMLNATLFLLVASSDNADVKKDFVINERFQQTLRYLNNHFTEELSLSKVAKEINMSPEYLSSFFKKHSGQKLSDYISELRLKHACNLTMSTDIPINEICFMSGYNSYSHFIRTFKKKYGDSPNHMRKIYQKSIKK